MAREEFGIEGSLALNSVQAYGNDCVRAPPPPLATILTPIVEEGMESAMENAE